MQKEPRAAVAFAPPQRRARLGVAVTRGLLLDLLATEDVEGVNAAMEAFIAFYSAWLNQTSGRTHL